MWTTVKVATAEAVKVAVRASAEVAVRASAEVAVRVTVVGWPMAVRCYRTGRR